MPFSYESVPFRQARQPSDPSHGLEVRRFASSLVIKGGTIARILTNDYDAIMPIAKSEPTFFVDESPRLSVSSIIGLAVSIVQKAGVAP